MKGIRLVMATAVLIAMIAAAAATPNNAKAAVVRSYADGPVLYLNKSETRYVGKASAAAAFAWFFSASGGWAAGVGAAAASIADTYVDQQVNRGYCLLVKMWWWNPQWLSLQWYSWWPCS
jgi:hypothetical protein